jgi:hypothetical protein
MQTVENGDKTQRVINNNKNIVGDLVQQRFTFMVAGLNTPNVPQPKTVKVIYKTTSFLHVKNRLKKIYQKK